MSRRSRQNLCYSHQTRVCCPCSEIVREEKENARNEKDRAAEIWRRIEKMGKDERGCGILPLRGYLILPENTNLVQLIYSSRQRFSLPATIFIVDIIVSAFIIHIRAPKIVNHDIIYS